ncbi:MAG: ABC transporter permease [Candidatus Omnitrophota bacterium]
MNSLFRNPLAFSGLIVVALLALAALAAPFLAPYDPAAVDLSHRLVEPSREHLLGTDQLGRDLFSRMVYGTRISLSIGFVAVGISVLIGILLGSIAGYFGGRLDTLIMRFVDIMLCFPTFFLILAVIALLEPSIFTIMAVIGVTSWMGVARLIRAEILSLKEQEFILAARAIGAGSFRIIVRHLIPNAMTPVLVSATLGVAAAILVESSLSFLGIGVQPPTASWGNILTEGKSVLGIAWWLTLFPGLAILLTVLAYNLLGEGLRDLLDPRLKDQI